MYRVIKSTFPIKEATNTSEITATSATVIPPMTGDGIPLDDGVGVSSGMSSNIEDDVSKPVKLSNCSNVDRL